MFDFCDDDNNSEIDVYCLIVMTNLLRDGWSGTWNEDADEVLIMPQYMKFMNMASSKVTMSGVDLHINKAQRTTTHWAPVCRV